MNLWWSVKAGSTVDTSHHNAAKWLERILPFPLTDSGSCGFWEISTTAETIKQAARGRRAQDQCLWQNALLIVFLPGFKWATDGLIQATGCAVTSPGQLATSSSDAASFSTTSLWLRKTFFFSPPSNICRVKGIKSACKVNIRTGTVWENEVISRERVDGGA